MITSRFFFGGDESPQGFFWGQGLITLIFFSSRDGPTEKLISNLSFVKIGMVDGVSFELYPPKFLHSDSSTKKKGINIFFPGKIKKIKKIKFDQI